MRAAATPTPTARRFARPTSCCGARCCPTEGCSNWLPRRRVRTCIIDRLSVSSSSRATRSSPASHGGSPCGSFSVRSRSPSAKHSGTRLHDRRDDGVPRTQGRREALNSTTNCLTQLDRFRQPQWASSDVVSEWRWIPNLAIGGCGRRVLISSAAISRDAAVSASASCIVGVDPRGGRQPDNSPPCSSNRSSARRPTRQS